MNKLLIVGHHASVIQNLGPALRGLGFCPPLPSLRETKRPEDLLAALRGSFDLPESWFPCAQEEFQQVQPGQAWQSAATDLILGNENQGPWFWLSPDLLPFLGFWRNQDPGFLVVMVYDHPRSALGVSPGQAMDVGSFRQRIENWEAYNSAMLAFYRQHPDHCLLVHGRGAFEDPESLADLIRERTGVGRMDGRTSGITGFLEHDHPDRESDRAERFLQDAFLSGFPHATTIYQELDSSSFLRSAHPVDAPSPENALADQVAFRSAVESRAKEEQAKESARRIWDLQLAEIQEALEKNYLETQGYKWRLGQAELRLKSPRGAAERVKQQLPYRIGSAIVSGTRSVPGFILMPVVLVVEILHFIITRARNRKLELPPLKDYADYQAGEKVKQQLSFRIGRAVLQNLKSPAGWLRLPAAVAGEIREFKKPGQKETAASETA